MPSDDANAHGRLPTNDGDRRGAARSRARALTLVAAEDLEAVAQAGLPIEAAATRRQVLVRGVNLSTLVGRRFRLGSALAEGSGPCAPCAHLEALVGPGVERALQGRAVRLRFVMKEADLYSLQFR